MVHATPTITTSALPNDSICKGSTVTLNGSGAVTYTWTNGITNGTTFTPTATATYTVAGTDANGCKASATQTITLNPLPVISIRSSESNTGVCPGVSVLLVASGANAYTWTNNGATTATITVSPSVSTIYTVSGTDANGCSATQTSTVIIRPAPTATVNAPSICIGQTATLTATSTGTVAIGLYLWNIGVNSPSITVTPSVTTNYTVVARAAGISTEGSCRDTIRTIVTVNPLPVITASANPNIPICSGYTVALTASGASTYTWTNGVINGVAFSPSVTATYSVTGTDANNCSDTSSIQVVVNSLCQTTGIVNENNAAAISVYPNPTAGNLFVQITNTENVSAEIYNSLGQLIFAKQLRSIKENINLEDVNPGMYLLRIKQNNVYIHQSHVIVNK